MRQVPPLAAADAARSVDAAPATDSQATELRSLLPVGTVLLLTKMLFATSRRSLFAYASFIAEYTGSLQTVLSVLACMNVVAVAAPLVLPIMLTHGLKHHHVLVVCIVLGFVSLVSLAATLTLACFVPAVLCLGGAVSLSSPAITALYSTLAKSARTKSALSALVELSYGMASFVGLPTFGALFAVSTSASFHALAAAMAAMLPAVWWVGWSRRHIPSRTSLQGQTTSKACCGGWRQLVRRNDWRTLVTVLFSAFGIMLTNEVASITFGMWLARDQGWDVASVGTATFAIGVSDLIGELFVIAFLSCWQRDPFAFSRGCLIVNCLACCILPPLCALGALPGIVAFMPMQAAAEAGIVGLLSCVITLSDASLHGQSDGTLESAFQMSSNLAKVIGDLTALHLYNAIPGGVLAFCTLGFILLFVATVFTFRWFPRPSVSPTMQGA